MNASVTHGTAEASSRLESGRIVHRIDQSVVRSQLWRALYTSSIPRHRYTVNALESTNIVTRVSTKYIARPRTALQTSLLGRWTAQQVSFPPRTSWTTLGNQGYRLHRPKVSTARITSPIRMGKYIHRHHYRGLLQCIRHRAPLIQHPKEWAAR